MKPIRNTFSVNNSDCYATIFYKNRNECEVRLRTISSFPENLEVCIESERIEIPIISKRITSLVFTYKTTTQLFPVEYANTKIPKIIMQYGTEAELTDEQKLRIVYNQELNPEYTYIFIENTDKRKHINDDRKSIYDSLENSFPCLYSLQNGGCYINIDTILRKPFRDIIEPDADCVIFENVNSCFATTKDNGKIQAFLNGEKNPFFTIKNYPYLKPVVERKVEIMRNRRELDNYVVLVYPHPYPDVFEFSMVAERLIKIQRHEPWWLDLVIKIIDKKEGSEYIVYVGASKDTNVKTMVF